MENDFRIVRFDPRTAGEDLWSSYLDHAEALQAEQDPEDTPLPRPLRRRMIVSSLDRPHGHLYFWALLAENGEVAGFAQATTTAPSSPSYRDNKHMANFQLSVLPARRGRGLGRALLRHVVGELAADEPQVKELLAPVTSEAGMKFFDRLGGTVSLVQAENRLRLGEVDWAMVKAWAEEGARRNPSTKVVTCSALPEEDILKFCEVYSETMNQQPLGDISIKIRVTPEQVRRGEKWSAENGAEHVTIYCKEEDGSVSGLTEVHYQKEAGHKVLQLLTGVKDSCRGRGLGKMLKALMLLYVREHYPAARYVVTSNADSNAPMMAINNRLGFKKHLPLYLYKLKLGAGKV